MSANDRTRVGVGSVEWRTPPDLYACLNRRYRFDYDPFATHDNALCVAYSTVEGTYRNRATFGERGGIEILSSQDGLAEPWADRRVFMNPPYSRDLIARCIEKAFDERDRAAIIVALLPSATETRWFQSWILPHCHIDWLPRRVRYIDPDTGEPGASPPSGAIVATFKADLMGEGRRA